MPTRTREQTVKNSRGEPVHPPRQYAWDVDGERRPGTLADYATDREHAACDGSHVGDLHDLYGAELELVTTSTTADDWCTVELRVPSTDEHAAYRIDLRA